MPLGFMAAMALLGIGSSMHQAQQTKKASKRMMDAEREADKQRRAMTLREQGTAKKRRITSEKISSAAADDIRNASLSAKGIAPIGADLSRAILNRV